MYDCNPSITSDLATTTSTCPTLDDALRLVATWDDLAPQRRRDLASALAGARRMCERYDAWRAEERAAPGASPAIASIPMDCAFLNERLFYRPLRAYGLRGGRFANILSGLRFILRRLGRHAPAEKGVAVLAPSWRTLHAALPNKLRQIALAGFLRFCSREGIAPDQVTSEVVARFEAWLLANTLCKLQNRRHVVLGTWNWAVDHVPGWPQHKLRSASGYAPYTLPFSAYPASFQADVERFAQRISGDADTIFGDHIFAAAGDAAPLPAPRPVRATTLRSRLFQIRMAAAALVLSGRSAETITALRDLIEPADNARAIIRFFYERAGRRRGSNAGNVAEVLRQIALYHCRLRPDEAARITRWARNVGQKSQASMTPKNLARLRALTVPRTRAMLLHLPQHLMGMAANAEHPTRAARLALRAVAIELLLVCPMRLSNLRLLRLDESLRRRDPDHPRRLTHLHLAAWETKNGVELDWPLPRTTADLLDRYLRRYRPTLAQPGNPSLFPGEAESALGARAMAGAVTDPIAREIGAVVNPHLLRHFAAWTYLRQHPGAYDLVRRVLGHKDVKTTIAYYCGLEAEFAAEAFDTAVLDERRRTRAVAQAALRAGASRRRAGRRGA